MKKADWSKYIVTFLITAGLFVTVFYVSKVFNEKRVGQIKSIQDSISIDLLSSETQFALLDQAGCTQDGNSILAPEIGEMGDRLSFMETQLGADNPDVIGLKKYYSLLQIKDYLLVSKFAKNCHTKPVTMIYFYNNDCADCTKQGYVLTALREKYPELRVYSFDASLDLSAIKTLETITKIPGAFPSLVVGGKVYSGYKSLEDIEKAVPALQKMLADQARKAAAEKAAIAAEKAKAEAEKAKLEAEKSAAKNSPTSAGTLTNSDSNSDATTPAPAVQ